jgi:hypothetical protein
LLYASNYPLTRKIPSNISLPYHPIYASACLFKRLAELQALEGVRLEGYSGQSLLGGV